MKIAIGCDHVGIILKPTIAEHLEAKGITVIDKGAHGEQRTDYPLYAKACLLYTSPSPRDRG